MTLEDIKAWAIAQWQNRGKFGLVWFTLGVLAGIVLTRIF